MVCQNNSRCRQKVPGIHASIAEQTAKYSCCCSSWFSLVFIWWESLKLQQPHSIKKDDAWSKFSLGTETWAWFFTSATSGFFQAHGQCSSCCLWAYPTGTTSMQACLSLWRLPKFAVCITLSRLCDHCRFWRLSKKIGGWGFSPLDWKAVCIARQSNKRSAHFSLSKFSHHFLLSLLSSLASEDDISTVSSRLSLAFPLSPLPGSSIFHPPWCLSAQRAASRLSSPKQAAFVSGPLESHRTHLGSVIFFKKDPGLVSDIFFHFSGIFH